MTRDPNTGRFSNQPAQRTSSTQRTWNAPQGQRRAQSDRACGVGVGSALAVAGGAAIGAALMFLLDPEAGEKRRRAAREAAAHAIDTTGNALGSTWEAVSDTAHHAAEHLTPDRSTRKGWRKSLNRATGALSGASATAGDTASDWLESAKSYLPGMPTRRSMRRSRDSWLDSAKEYLPARQTGAGPTTVGL